MTATAPATVIILQEQVMILYEGQCLKHQRLSQKKNQESRIVELAWDNLNNFHKLFCKTYFGTWEATCQKHPEIRSIRSCSTQNDLVQCTLECADSLSSEKRLTPSDGIATSSLIILLRPWSLSPFTYCTSLRQDPICPWEVLNSVVHSIIELFGELINKHEIN